MSHQFSPEEQAVLRIVQNNLPDSLTPYADVAEQAGISEAQVIDLLCRLKESGAIRRFGASIKHQKTGWTHNAMVAWKVSPEQVDQCGRKVAEHDHISHAYYRPSSAVDWPYELYTMIHGRSEAECLSVVDDIMRDTDLKEHAILRSLKELKKISMTYFA
ncbi:siroheme decarboxylase subunit beta [Desulfovibrio intestinalis]|uniref:siroheme decarboxylase n=1 Tax=Desulfovibrio intestinalis TaxID=58621 RepID=A0A7W8C1W6_9BACT|nr:siroheme decarboxylase subunit beta [Desulfovibrio intestinalis]MBB5143338.1 DNA-binding Lrp family transcriptional regulator [Desulfovibrio intestinalis]